MTVAPPKESRPRRPINALSGARHGVDTAFAVLVILFTIALFVQIYLAGAGAFAHHTVHQAYAAHEDLGNVLGIAAIVLLVLALVARLNRATMVGAFFLAVLTELAQHGLAQAGHHNRWIGGLHALDGMLILALASWLSIAAYQRCPRPAGW